MFGAYIPIQEGLGPYTGCVRRSFYVDGAQEGVKIACDLYLPADGQGKVVEQALPLVLHTGMGGRRKDETPEITFTLIANGYAVMRCDNRQEGASHGVSNSFMGLDQGADIKCVIEWCAAQPWCSGKIGMHGISNKGFIQWTTACNFPEHLTAITPIVCNADFYYVNHPNGVNGAPKHMGGFGGGIPGMPRKLQIGVPVDDDPAPGYPQAYKAALDREGKQLNWFEKTSPENQCRDWVDPGLGYAPSLVDAPIEYIDQIKAKGYRIRQFAGWFDSNASGQLMVHNLVGERIIVGPWNHGEGNTGHSAFADGCLDMAREHLRWFDDCLKGIPSQRPPVTYYTINAPEGQRWQESQVWPPEDCVQVPFYLDAEGGLGQTIPQSSCVQYTVDDDVAIFDPWGRMNTLITRDMNPDCDSKALCFTTAPLTQGTELTGHCAAELWASSTAEDGNFIAVIEDVFPNGESHYITSGCLRASHRRLDEHPAFASVGVPYHRSLEAEMEPLVPGEPAFLAFCIDATSYYFPAGHRIRVSIACGEKSAMQQPACVDLSHPPEVTLYTGGRMASRVLLSLKK